MNIPDIERLMNIAYLEKMTVPVILCGEEYKYFLINESTDYTEFSKLNSLESLEKIIN